MCRYQHIWDMESGQDGAIYGEYLFRFDAKGSCNVYSIPEKKKVSAFVLDKIEVLKPHSNAVCFGTEFYEETDEFPLLYSNIYNNYAKAEDRLEGVCCVYRLTRQSDQFQTRLVQVIRIGFVENLDYWMSLPDNGDVRPYGNFVVDTDRQKLYAFTMRDKEQITRYFAFALPQAAEGVYDEAFGVKVVTLHLEDIQVQFDCEYSRFIQGACYHDNKIYSVEGFSNEKNPPRMRVIDLVKKEQIAVVDLYGLGLTIEPEFVDFCEGQLIYSNAAGNVYLFTEC